MILRRALASAAVLAALVGTGLGTAVAANASVVNGPTSNGIYAAGFQVSGTTSINEVRSNVTVASNATSDAYLFLESNVNGGDEYVVSLRNEGGEYFLAAADAHGVTNPVTGAPAISGLTFHNIPTVHSADGSLFSAADGGAFTIELHYSTSKHTVVVVAGQSENNVASLDTFTGVHGTFTAPAIEGVSTHPFAHNTDLFFNRNGLTEPAGSNVGGVAGTRVTLDFFNLDQTQGVNGPAINLAASALPTTSSDFTVTNNANLTVTAPFIINDSITNTVSPDTYSTVGQPLNYKFTVKNTGNERLTNVSVTDEYTGTTSAPGAPVVTNTPASLSVSCPHTALNAGQSEVCTAQLGAVSGDFSISNTATVHAKYINYTLPVKSATSVANYVAV